MSCIIRDPLNPCLDHDKITPIKLHKRCQVHAHDSSEDPDPISDGSPSESTQDFELRASVGTSRNIANTQTEASKEDDSTVLNDEEISQQSVKIYEASSFEKEQDLLHLAFRELEVRLFMFGILV